MQVFCSSDESKQEICKAVRYIFGFYSCDKKLIKVNVKPTLYCSLHCCKLYFRDHAFVVYLRTIKVHNDSIFKELTVHFLLQKSHLWNPPMPSDFQTLCSTGYSVIEQFQKISIPSHSGGGGRYGYSLELHIAPEHFIHYVSITFFPCFTPEM